MHRAEIQHLASALVTTPAGRTGAKCARYLKGEHDCPESAAGEGVPGPVGSQRTCARAHLISSNMPDPTSRSVLKPSMRASARILRRPYSSVLKRHRFTFLPTTASVIYEIIGSIPLQPNKLAFVDTLARFKLRDERLPIDRIQQPMTDAPPQARCCGPWQTIGRLLGFSQGRTRSGGSRGQLTVPKHPGRQWALGQHRCNRRRLPLVLRVFADVWG